MEISKTNKIIITLGAFFILFTLFVGFGLRPKENISTKQIEAISDYEVIEQDSQKIIKSKEAGFSMFLPSDWIIKNYGSKISFSSSEIKIELGKEVSETIKENNICSGSLEIKKYAKKDHQDILSLLDLIHQVEIGKKGKDRDYAYSLAEAGGKTFLKITFTKQGQPVYISTKTVNNGKIYYINSGLFFSEQCGQAFDTIFESVKIK